MKNTPVQKCMYALSIVLLTSLFAACDGSSSASGITPTPTVAATATTAANQPATPTSVTETGKAPATAAKATSATTADQPVTPTSVADTGKGLQPFTGVDFTMLYPAKWQKTHKSIAAHTSGENHFPEENIYGFVAQDNISGLHIVRRGDEQAVGGMVNELIGGELKCDMGDKSVPSTTVTAGGVSWSQVDLICLVASNNYEVRELVRSDSKYGQTVIMYGAYQQVGKGAVVPDFAHTKATYFDPMLASFKFN